MDRYVLLYDDAEPTLRVGTLVRNSADGVLSNLLYISYYYLLT